MLKPTPPTIHIYRDGNSTPRRPGEPHRYHWGWVVVLAGLLVVLIAALALASHPSHPEPVRESVDLIEINHLYDEQGRLVFDQAIFYRWCDRQARYEVVAWRLVKHPAQLPCRDWTGGGWLSVWQDGDLIRHVRAQSVRETWTQFDPELVEREWLPKERRVELRAVKCEAKREAP